MAWFTHDFLAFFQELSANNQREWFHANKKRYESFVKNPFHDFVLAMIARINGVDPSVAIQPKEAIFRINRDIRFSKDKSPYKLYMAAGISRFGRKSQQEPGLYFHLGADKAVVASGAYEVSKDSLPKIRQAIASQPDRFAMLINQPDFVAKFGSIRGDQHKRVPREFKEAHAHQPLIANKQFYYWAEMPPETILGEDFADELMTYYHAASNLNQFLSEAMTCQSPEEME